MRSRFDGPQAKQSLARWLANTSAIARVLTIGVAALAGTTPVIAASWEGDISTDWFDPNNWTSNAVPDGAETVTINIYAPNPTDINAGNAFADDIIIGNGFFNSGQLSISNNSTLTSSSAVLANGTSSVGHAAVYGVGSSWTNSGDMTVGEGGHATLTIASGGVVNNATGIIGDKVGSAGAVTVNGAGSTWSNSGDLTVGGSGTGTLTIANGGAVINVNGYVGKNADSTGTVTVTGAGSNWNNTSTYIGYAGTGTLNILNGGVVANTSGRIGYDVGAIGMVNLDGVGSTWLSSAIYVGHDGNGTFNITNGGTATNSTGIIGDAAGSTGTATVTGAGSTWSNSGDLTVGGSGTGTLTIANGGAVSNVNGYIGQNAGATGTVNVTGAGATWTNTNALFVGNASTGALHISSGGAVSSSTAFIGSGTGGTGTVTVDGAGSAWTIANGMFVGQNGTGILTVSNGGSMTSLAGLFIAGNLGSSGALNIGGAAGAGATGAGALTANVILFGNGTGTLNFNHTDLNFGLASNISGLGTINQIAGLTNLSGNSAGFTGTTNVSGGGLYVNGALGGLVTVTGGFLGGTGTVGGVTIASGGTFAPGNSIGTITVASTTFLAGSIYDVEVESGGTSDLINATGIVTINGGSVNVIAFPDYALGTTYTIVTAAGGVNGQFDSAAFAGTIFISAALTYDANNVYLNLAQLSFADLGLTQNQKAAAAGAESLGAGNPLYDAIATLGTTAEAQAAFDAISGEIHASAKTALIEDSRFVREAANARVRAAFGGVGASRDAGTGVWAQGFGAYGQADSDGNAAALNHDTRGVFVGADFAMMDDWQFGVMAGTSHTGFDANARASSGTATSRHLGVYGGTEWGSLAFRFGGAYGQHDIEITRTAAFPGVDTDLLSSYAAVTGQVFGELGYRIDKGALRLEPFANLTYISHRTDGFEEDGGAAVTALTGAGDQVNMAFTTLGVRADTDLAFGQTTTARLTGMLGWRHALGDTTPGQSLAFAGGSAFSVAGAPIARDAVMIEAGIDFDFTPTATLGINYSGQIGSGVSDHGIKANFSLKF